MYDTELAPARAQLLGRWVGIFFIITYVTSIPALLLFGPVRNDPRYVIGAGNDTQIYVAALLETLLIFANIGSAVVLYPLLRRRFPVGAIGYVASRITESAFIGVGIVSVLSVVSIRDAGSSSSALPVVAEALVAIKDWSFLLGPGMVVPIGNGLLLGTMMYRTGIVPRGMALFGLVGGPALFVASVGVLFGAVAQSSTVYTLAVVPQFIWELALGVYLTVTGGRLASPVR